MPIRQLRAEPWDVADIGQMVWGDLNVCVGFVLLNACISGVGETLHGDHSSLGVWCMLHTEAFNWKQMRISEKNRNKNWSHVAVWYICGAARVLSCTVLYK